MKLYKVLVGLALVSTMCFAYTLNAEEATIPETIEETVDKTVDQPNEEPITDVIEEASEVEQEDEQVESGTLGNTQTEEEEKEYNEKLPEEEAVEIPSTQEVEGLETETPTEQDNKVETETKVEEETEMETPVEEETEMETPSELPEEPEIPVEEIKEELKQEVPELEGLASAPEIEVEVTDGKYIEYVFTNTRDEEIILNSITFSGNDDWTEISQDQEFEVNSHTFKFKVVDFTSGRVVTPHEQVILKLVLEVAPQYESMVDVNIGNVVVDFN